MHFPAEKCTFLQKNAVFRGAQGRKLKEIAGGFQNSRIKRATQLLQEEIRFYSPPPLALLQSISLNILLSLCWFFQEICRLRGPAAILFISRDTCSDSVSQEYSVPVFMGYRTIIARYVAKWGIAQMCLCETIGTKGGGVIVPCSGSANLPTKASRDMGHRSDSIAISRDMGPLSLQVH